MSNDKPKITKIILTIGKKEIQLTPAEVKDLKAALEQMYPSPKEREYIGVPTYEKPYSPWRDKWWLDPYCLTAQAGGITLCAKE